MKVKPNEPRSLRKAAEEKLAGAPKVAEPARSAEQLLFELQVHQLELEMQNETLRQSLIELEESRDRYVDFYDFAPVGYLSLNHEGKVEAINLPGAAMLGGVRSKLLRRSFANFVDAEDRDRWRRHFLNVLTSDRAMTCELALQRADASRFYARLDCLRLGKPGKTPVVRIVLTDITESKETEQMLRQHKLVIDTAIDGFWMVDEEGRLLEVNKAYAELIGYSIEELTGMHVSQLEAKEQSREEIKAHMAKVIAQGHERFETRHRHKDGREIDLEISATFMPESRRFCVFCYDITKRKLAENAVRAQEEFFRLIAENVEDFIAVLDLEGRRLYNSPSYARFFGNVTTMQGKDSFAEIHPDDLERVKRAFRDTVRSGRGYRLNFRFVLADGSIRYMESCGGLIRSSQGQPLRVVVVSRDITERIKLEEEIHSLAFYDTLTQLPNRRLLSDRLDQAMAASNRSGHYGALMLLDLDNFKPLNDVHGHNMGDLLLIEAARRITCCVREMDTVARFGGDEFVVVLNELDADQAESAEQSGIVAEKIRAILAEPYRLKFKPEGAAETIVEHRCTASIGVVLFNNHEASAEDIVKWADVAMYQAKNAGRNTIRFYGQKA